MGPPPAPARKPAAAPPARGRGGRRLAVAASACLLLGSAAAFALPWLPDAPPGGEQLERYVPARDGRASLSQVRDARGRLIGFRSVTEVQLPAFQVFGELRAGFQEVIEEHYAGGGDGAVPVDELADRLSDIRILQSRTVAAGAAPRSRAEPESLGISVRDDRGIHLVGFFEEGQEQVFDPPALLLPAELEAGRRWQSEGRVGTAGYELTGRVMAKGPYSGPLGRFDDCLAVETRLAVTATGQRSESRFEDRYCAGAGEVESRELTADGALARLTATVATQEQPPDAGALPPPSAATAAEGPLREPEGWQFSRIGRARLSGAVAASSIAPAYVPGDPPLVLAAGERGDLVALDPADGQARWRFHTPGTVFGAPGLDRRTGRIYFGSSDKRLYALDRRGLFLWSFETGDNVPSRPLVAGGTVVFGSEDRSVYGLDARTGRQRWRRRTGGAVGSSPALVGDTVVVGSDDGRVYGLDPRTGRERWARGAGGAVEAPVAAGGGTAYAVSRGGRVVAIEAASGDERWSVDLDRVLRSAPAVGETTIWVVEEAGRLFALDRRDGSGRWRRKGDFVGPPVVAGDSLVVADRNGVVHRLGHDGRPLGSWRAAAATIPSDQEPAFALGPTVGGGALWLGDRSSVVRRLGPAGEGPASPLRLRWIRPFTEPPFGSHLLSSTVAAHRGRGVVLDGDGNVYLIDPASGSGRRLGRVQDRGAPAGTGAVVADDVLLAVAQGTLHALSLPDGRRLWRRRSGRVALRPPVVAGGRVALVTATTEGDEVRSADLELLDLRTGDLRWRARLAYGLGAAVDETAVYAGAPPRAFDLESGRPLWTRRVPETASPGSPALDPAGRTVYFPLAEREGPGAAVVALDARTGRERWRAAAPLVGLADRLHVDSGVVVVPGSEGAITGLDARTGARRWQYRPPARPFGTVLVEQGRVWLVLENADLVALDVRTGEPAATFTGLDLELSSLSGQLQRPTLVGDTLLAPLGPALMGVDVGSRR